MVKQIRTALYKVRTLVGFKNDCEHLNINHLNEKTINDRRIEKKENSEFNESLNILEPKCIFSQSTIHIW